LLTHQFDDPHPDHHHIAQLVRESARLASMRKYDADFGQEKIQVPIVAHNIFSQRVAPSFIVDISEFLEQKTEAIRAHASQFYNPNSREPETRLTSKGFIAELENRSRYFGQFNRRGGGRAVFRPRGVERRRPDCASNASDESLFLNLNCLAFAA
jgi:LmbE family N-acetylglucosaminyl deacetylase